jgi:hypothetical protein
MFTISNGSNPIKKRKAHPGRYNAKRNTRHEKKKKSPRTSGTILLLLSAIRIHENKTLPKISAVLIGCTARSNL